MNALLELINHANHVTCQNLPSHLLPSGPIKIQSRQHIGDEHPTTTDTTTDATADTTERGLVQSTGTLCFQGASSQVVFEYFTIDTLPSELFEWAYLLVTSNMKDMYDLYDDDGFNDVQKRNEMGEKEARYIVASVHLHPQQLEQKDTTELSSRWMTKRKHDIVDENAIEDHQDFRVKVPVGFVYFQYSSEPPLEDHISPMDGDGIENHSIHEDDLSLDHDMIPVLYCYELQVEPSYQHLGIGRKLMELLEPIAATFQMDKILLTVFKGNKKAMKFYRDKLRYEIDETSPSMCCSLEEANDFSYEILGKAIPRLSG